MTFEPINKEPLEPGLIEYGGFQHGLNTNDSVFSLKPTEAAELLNFKILRGGAIQTRPPITKYSVTATTSNAAVKAIASAIIAGTNQFLLSDANNVLYYLDGDEEAVSIGSISGTPVILSFNNVALILDGSYIKYLDGVTAVKIAYDNGSGTTGFQFNNRSGARNTTLALGNGTNTRIAYKFTSQAWDAGFTIPPTTLYVYVSKTGSPTGTIVMKIRKVADDSILATKTLYADVSALTGTAEEAYATFASTDITMQMSPGTAYYASVEYDAGDASNYVNVHCTTVASAGTGYHYAAAAWTSDATYTPCMGLKPGRPPKATFGAVHNGRPFVSGDSSYPGYVWYGNRSHLDWSTTDLGGYVTAIDDNANTYAVGAIESLYGELYVFGTETQPYICKLTGATPDEYLLTVQFQRSWTTSKTLINTGNDLLFCSGDGVDTLSGVQEYGDLRTSTFSAPVDNKLTDYYSSSTAIAGYYPKDGQYWLYLPAYSRVLVCHIKMPTSDDSESVRYPWSEYQLYRDVFTSSTYKWIDNSGEWYLQAAAGGTPGLLAKPDFISLDGTILTEGTAGSLEEHQWDYGLDPSATYNTVYLNDTTGDPDTSGVEVRSIFAPQCFATIASTFYIGGSDGFVYKINPAEYKELTTRQITFDVRGRYSEAAFGKIIIDAYKLICSGRLGGQFTFNLYKDDSTGTVSYTVDMSLALDDRLTVDDMTGDVDDAYFSADPQGASTFRRMQMLCRSVQPQITDLLLSGEPVTIRGIVFKYRKAEM